jgi:hypothetical protein
MHTCTLSGAAVLNMATASHTTADNGPKRWAACAGCGQYYPPTALLCMHAPTRNEGPCMRSCASALRNGLRACTHPLARSLAEHPHSRCASRVHQERYAKHFYRMVELSASSEAAAFAIAEAGLAELHSRIEFVASGNAGRVSGSAAGAAPHDTGSSTNLITLRRDCMHGQLNLLACGQLQTSWRPRCEPNNTAPRLHAQPIEGAC